MPAGDFAGNLSPESLYAESQGSWTTRRRARRRNGRPSQDPRARDAQEVERRPPASPVETPELEQLRAENAELRRTLAELQQQVDEQRPAGAPVDNSWADRQREYEALLEEKSEVIRGLHQKIHELQARPGESTLPREEELLALGEQLEQEQRQLQLDEEALQNQMREMEVQMSRERAELARQRHELTRLHGEIEHELETAARDSKLRERLMPLRRRHQQMLNPGAEPLPEDPANPGEQAPPPAAKDAGGKRDSGLLRRLFGQRKPPES